MLDVLSYFWLTFPRVPPEIIELVNTGSLSFLSPDPTESFGRWYDFYLELFIDETENLTSSILSFSLSLPLEIFFRTKVFVYLLFLFSSGTLFSSIIRLFDWIGLNYCKLLDCWLLRIT